VFADSGISSSSSVATVSSEKILAPLTRCRSFHIGQCGRARPSLTPATDDDDSDDDDDDVVAETGTRTRGRKANHIYWLQLGLL